jgi:hypothetical protein
MKTDGNGRKDSISAFVSIFFFGEDGIGFGKCGYRNRTGIFGYTETNQYGRKLNGNGWKPGTQAGIPHIFILINHNHTQELKKTRICVHSSLSIIVHVNRSTQFTLHN